MVMHDSWYWVLGGPAASALLLADNTFRLGTTNHYNIVMEPKRPCNDAAAADFRVDAAVTTRTQPDNTFSGITAGSTWQSLNTSSTYVFTAPTAGVYWFQATVIIRAVANGTNLYDALRFRINGAVVGYSTRRGIYNTTSMSMGYFVDEIARRLSVSANDTVVLLVNTASVSTAITFILVSTVS